MKTFLLALSLACAPPVLAQGMPTVDQARTPGAPLPDTLPLPTEEPMDTDAPKPLLDPAPPSEEAMKKDEPQTASEPDAPQSPPPAATVIGPIRTLDGGPAPRVAKVSQDSQETIDDTSYFYEPLQEYGVWYDSPDYGAIWRPNVADSANWQPYVDGRWTYTNAGWTWHSNEPFGWATFHYGRWTNIARLGWAWVPGLEWSPGNVTWRIGSNYVGWAPLPPRYAGVGLGRGGYEDPCFSMGIGPDWYVFLRNDNLGRSSYNDCLWDRRERSRCLVDSRSLSEPCNIPGGADPRFRHYGPDYRELGRNGVPSLNLDLRRGDDPRGLTRINGSSYLYQIPKNRKGPGREVPLRGLGSADETRGWSNSHGWEQTQHEFASHQQARNPAYPSVVTMDPRATRGGRIGGVAVVPSNQSPTNERRYPINERRCPTQPYYPQHPIAPDLVTDRPMIPQPPSHPPAFPPPVVMPGGSSPGVRVGGVPYAPGGQSSTGVRMSGVPVIPNGAMYRSFPGAQVRQRRGR